jgi:stress-induced morphogen
MNSKNGKNEHAWHSMRTKETRMIENALRKEFPTTDAYRYNSASIRVRVIDPRFEGKSISQRDAMVEPFLAELPEQTQADIMNLITLTPGEIKDSIGKSLANLEFEEPSKSML